jgi:hypothetical protein
MDEIDLLRNIVSHLDSAELAPGVVTSTHLNVLPRIREAPSNPGPVFFAVKLNAAPFRKIE